MARTARKPNGSKDSTAATGFEATALRDSATRQRAAKLRSPQGNRWLTADNGAS